MISKWDMQVLAKHASAEQVDVAMFLIGAFKPDEKQKKSAVEIQKHEPVSLENMKNHKHEEHINQRVDPAVKTPVESGNEQGTGIHL